METVQSKLLNAVNVAFSNNPLPWLAFHKRRQRKEVLRIIDVSYENGFHEYRTSLEELHNLNELGHFTKDSRSFQSVMAVIETGVQGTASIY